MVMNSHQDGRRLTIVLLLAAALQIAFVPCTALNDRNGNPFMDEVAPKADDETRGWRDIYSAYSCVYHHEYSLADRWLRYALFHGAGSLLLKANIDISYLSDGLNKVAAQRHEAAVPGSSPNVQVLQAFIQSIVGTQNDALDTLKKVSLNNPNYASAAFLKAKIRSMEFEMSGNPWLVPPDVEQTGGRNDHFSRWRNNKFPLKIYIPTDASAAKVDGYHAGDSELLRSAFEEWQRQSGGKVRFVLEPVQSRADVTCAWKSEQKDMLLADAIGVCSRAADGNNYLYHAEIRVLTFTSGRSVPSGFDNQFRKNCLKEVCLHEIGHSVGLNHSSSENDVMCAHAHWRPLIAPTTRDLAALSSLYFTHVADTINGALDAIRLGEYEGAIGPLDKVLASNPKDEQTRNMICICLNNAATNALTKKNYTTAINLLTRANGLATGKDSKHIQDRVITNLYYAYLQAGRTHEASQLAKENPSLDITDDESTSFLDKYGATRDAIPYYEEALAKNPDDPAIRKRFCFLLLILAQNELSKDNNDEAISLLTRAKNLLRQGMPRSVINKVMNTLYQACSAAGRYDEADETTRFADSLMPKPPDTTPHDDVAALVAAAKKKDPKAWSNPEAEKAKTGEIQAVYEQYVQTLRECATKLNVKQQAGWAAIFIVRHRQFAARDILQPVYSFRQHLVALTDENAVTDVECALPFTTTGQSSYPPGWSGRAP